MITECHRMAKEYFMKSMGPHNATEHFPARHQGTVKCFPFKVSGPWNTTECSELFFKFIV